MKNPKFIFDKNTFFSFFQKSVFEGKKTCLPSPSSIQLFIIRLFNGFNGSLVTTSLKEMFLEFFFQFFFFWFEIDLESFSEVREHQVMTTKKAESCFQFSRQIVLRNAFFLFCNN